MKRGCTCASLYTLLAATQRSSRKRGWAFDNVEEEFGEAEVMINICIHASVNHFLTEVDNNCL